MPPTSNTPAHVQREALLERTDHLRELWTYLDEAKEGRGSIVLLGGHAGIGKTSLIREFCSRAKRNVRVLLGACDALSTTEPLAPVFDIADAAGEDTGALLDQRGSIAADERE